MGKKKTFWAQQHHVTNLGAVIPWFGHYVKVASKPGVALEGLERTVVGIITYAAEDILSKLLIFK